MNSGSFLVNEIYPSPRTGLILILLWRNVYSYFPLFSNPLGILIFLDFPILLIFLFPLTSNSLGILIFLYFPIILVFLFFLKNLRASRSTFILLLFTFYQVCLPVKDWETETGMSEKSSWDQANIRQKLGLVWINIKKISQIIKDYFYLPFFFLIILCL